jgi:hypothetical protein
MPEWLWYLIILLIAGTASAPFLIRKKAPTSLTGFKPKNKLFPDPAIKKLQDMFEGKILVEPLKTKINRHAIFWIGRSDIDGELRIGIDFSGGRRYFFNWNDFQQDARCKEYQVMTPVEADQLEAEIKQNRKKPKV